MTSQYIYLLQEREFIKTKEDIYKVGRTEKQNLERFNQYPKGSNLLFHMICNDNKNIEKQVISLFKKKFELRKDIGNEYFEGEYKNMIDIIYSTINEEKDIVKKDNVKYDNDKYSEEFFEELYKLPIYEITTYDEWIKYNPEISKVIIINKRTKEGFLKFKKQLWRKLYNNNNLEFEDNEYLLGFIYYYQNALLYKNKITGEFIIHDDYLKLDNIEQSNYNTDCDEIKYNEKKILEDVIKKCYVKEYDFYNLDYGEYVLNISPSYSDIIYNSKNITFTSVDEFINNKILTKKESGEHGSCCSTSIYLKNRTNINIDIVDNILNSLISPEFKLEYKNLVYNLLVKQEEKEIIFYDYGEWCLLTTWIKELLDKISANKFYIVSCYYYWNKKHYNKLFKTKKPRCVFISNHKDIRCSIETQINHFRKIGIKNIIVPQASRWNANEMYDIINFRKYLKDNKDILINYMKEDVDWYRVFRHDDNIFSSSEMLFINFLKWCCIK
jgi:hypothetical protein